MKATFGLIAIFFVVGSYAPPPREQLQLAPFVNISNGFYDTWSQMNSENVRSGNFYAQFGHSTLFLVSNWNPAVRGGVVTTLRPSGGSPYPREYKRYPRLEVDAHQAKVFTLHDELFMLTYSTNQSIAFHNLYYWNDNRGEWRKVPLEVQPTATTTTGNAIQFLSVNVPKQEENVAYVVASAHGHASGGSELAFSKLEVQYDGHLATKATLKSLAHERPTKPTAVAFTAVKNNKLYALVQHFMSEGYVADYEKAYALDLTTNGVVSVSISGTRPGVDFGEGCMHQTENEILIVGGRRVVGLGRVENVDDIFYLNLQMMHWEKTQYKIPQGSGRRSAYDQEGKRLYLIGMKEGILQSQLSRSD